MQVHTDNGCVVLSFSARLNRIRCIRWCSSKVRSSGNRSTCRIERIHKYLIISLECAVNRTDIRKSCRRCGQTNWRQTRPMCWTHNIVTMGNLLCLRLSRKYSHHSCVSQNKFKDTRLKIQNNSHVKREN